MDWLLQNAGNYWWLIFVFGGSASAAVKGVSAWNERRANRRLERFRIKQEAKVALARAQGMGRVDEAAAKKELARVVAQHDAVDTRWFGYETDLATILDYPMMVDMREQLTVEFHKAKRRADLLRPDSPDAIDGSRSTATPCTPTRGRSTWPSRRRSVAAAAISIRWSRSAWPGPSASSPSRSTAEPPAPRRQQAYQRARKELDGLIDLPRPATVALERQVQAAIER